MKPGGPERLYIWIYYLTAGFLFAAVVLRSLLQENPSLSRTLPLLLTWGVLFVTEPALSSRRRHGFSAYLALQCLLIALLISQSDAADFFAILFPVLGMQVMQRYPPRRGAMALAAFVPVMAVPMLTTYESSQALIFVVIYSAASVLLAAYSLATRRATRAAEHNQAMATELQATNRRVRAYSEQLERLAVTRERHRLARDLHDSVTQTIFSMTLTTQSAALLLEQDPPRVAAQLERLGELTRGALAEMQLLVTELRPNKPLPGGLLAGLERYLSERARPQGLAAALEVEGEDSLSEAEESTLFRIAQEAINNIIKHAGASEAAVRLRFSPYPRLEVVDDGQGFDVLGARQGTGMGLDSMNERAAEIGWDLQISSSLEAGTMIVVEKKPKEEA